jgi:gamma-glutamyltranspeptidase/glutathione hydrolase
MKGRVFMEYDALNYPHSSRRNVIFGNKGMVATSQPLAAQAGLDILKKGGNAVDAAIATAVCLTVVEPTSNGIGSDAFAIVSMDNNLYGLNASGPSPRGISIEALIKEGYKEMPQYGWVPVTVPGAPGAWVSLSSRFGRLPLTEVMAPAIEYAAGGYAVTPTTAKYWQIALNEYKKQLKEDEFQYFFKTFAPHGKAPAPGEVWSSIDIAKTLQSIAETNGESFYSGDLMEKIDEFSRKSGGYLRKIDLENFKPKWVDPVKINYRGYEVWEIPPNGQGIVALMALNILKGFDFKKNDPLETYHKQIEAVKIALTDGQRYITDPDYMEIDVKDLLSDNYAEEKRKLIGRQALLPEPGSSSDSDTVYLATADNEGNMVSYIQSNFVHFGSGIVVPQTGISLQNRGYTFSLNKQHVNCLSPGKRSYHTIIPGFLSKNGTPVGPFGIVGGFMQTQAHVQVIMNVIDLHLNPQASLDAPRWQWLRGKHVAIEPAFLQSHAESLGELGHEIQRETDYGGITEAFFGRGQIIWRDEENVFAAGTDPRTDGYIAVW